MEAFGEPQKKLYDDIYARMQEHAVEQNMESKRVLVVHWTEDVVKNRLYGELFKWGIDSSLLGEVNRALGAAKNCNVENTKGKKMMFNSYERPWLSQHIWVRWELELVWWLNKWDQNHLLLTIS